MKHVLYVKSVRRNDGWSIEKEVVSLFFTAFELLVPSGQLTPKKQQEEESLSGNAAAVDKQPVGKRERARERESLRLTWKRKR